MALAALVASGASSSCAGDHGEDRLGAALDRMEELVEQRAYGDALAVADRLEAPGALSHARLAIEDATRGASESLVEPVSLLLDALGIHAPTAQDRGEIEFARALTLLASASDPDAAQPDGESDERIERATRSLGVARQAGGPVAASAVEALADLQLAAAEAVRMTIPEIAGRESGPVAPPATGPGAGPSDMAAKDDSDPLERARELYLAARQRFVERLTLEVRVEGTGDPADARANAELVTRRLRELDEIERQREEQEQSQDDQQQSEGDSSESKDDENEPKEGEPEEGEQDPEDQGDPEESESPEDPQPNEDEGEEPSEEPEPEEGEEPQAEEESDANEAPETEREVTEVEMTAEEQQRLMEKNRAYQEAGDERRRLLRARRRGTSKRDW